ncbi:MAG: 5'-nucleotidase C-terminal domain-containing protein [Coprococcus sp.]
MLDAAASDGAVVALIAGSVDFRYTGQWYCFKGQIQNLFDDQLYLVTCKMTGGDRGPPRNGFNNYPNADGFLQVSGISYAFNASTAIGSRLSDIMIDGHKLDDARTYIVATTNILADTLGYRSEATGRIGTYRTIASVVTDYIQKNSSATSGSALPSETESDTEDTTASGETADTSRIQINE